MKKERKKPEPWQLEDAKRLNDLYESRKDSLKMSQAEFGARYDIGSQGMVWQYLRGHAPLNIKAAKDFAKGLGVQVEDFSPTIARQIAQAAKAVRPQQWPFEEIDEGKVRSLTADQISKLEGGILAAAGYIGLDIKKEDPADA